MKIAIYTLTRDRLEYTKHCFAVLREKAGMAFDHYVIDNGSTDGSATWLQMNSEWFKKIVLLPENVGISVGSNMMLDEIGRGGYDLIIKMDNDCEVVSDNILVQIEGIFERLKMDTRQMVLSPRVEGINKQPKRSMIIYSGGFRIGITGIVGGLFHVVAADIYARYRYPVDLPPAWGQDDDFCEWLRQQNIQKGYIEDLVVNHYETTVGQAARFPGYFERKWKEEKKV